MFCYICFFAFATTIPRCGKTESIQVFAVSLTYLLEQNDLKHLALKFFLVSEENFTQLHPIH